MNKEVCKDSIKLKLTLISARNISRHQENLYAKISIGGEENSKMKTSMCRREENSECHFSFGCTYTLDEMAVREGNTKLVVELYGKQRWFSWPFRHKYVGKFDVKLVELYKDAGGTGKRKTESKHLRKCIVKSKVVLEFTYEFVDFTKGGFAKWKKGLKFVGKVVWAAVPVLTSVFAN